MATPREEAKALDRPCYHRQALLEGTQGRAADCERGVRRVQPHLAQAVAGRTSRIYAGCIEAARAQAQSQERR